MARIALLTPHLTTADAISNDIYGMYEVLKTKGHDVRLFAQDNTLNGVEVLPVKQVATFLTSAEDLLIYHYSMGWDIGLNLLHDLSCLTAVKYHNITPPQFFAGISSDYERVCSLGRQQIKDIAQADCDIYLADSEYNLWELLLEGVEKPKGFVVPPFHHIDRLKALLPDSDVLDAYIGDKVKILMVGRVAPNKGHSTLIEAFAIYRREYHSEALLLIVGKEPEHLESYSTSLREMVNRLDLQEAVVFTGGVSDEQLKAYYLVADIFMMASHHEGFCVPLVEAMAMKVPIVTCASSAIPGTVGKAGLVWKERNPYLLAESLNFLARDEATCAALGLLGWRRYERLFSNERIEAELFNALNHLI